MKRSFSANDVSARPARNNRPPPSPLQEEVEEGLIEDNFFFTFSFVFIWSIEEEVKFNRRVKEDQTYLAKGTQRRPLSSKKTNSSI